MDTLIHDVEEVLELIGVGFDILGVVIICVGTALALVRSGALAIRSHNNNESSPYRRLKIDIGLALLLGLEVLVAADIIKTVAIEPNLDSLSVLGLLVIIRTFLSWTLVLEIEGRWPWQSDNETEPIADS